MKRILGAVVEWRSLARLVSKLRSLAVIVVALLFLTGCVRYDVGINFSGQNHGEIVQHIRISEQLTSFSDSVARDWLKSIEQRARQLGGRTKRLSQREIITTIPFNNGAELEEKFNDFFTAITSQTVQPSDVERLALPDVGSHLHIKQNNLFLVERNNLTFDLDLRPLGVLSSNGNLLISPGSLLDLKFSLTTPWGAHIADPSSLAPDAQDDGNLIWILKAGELNHLDVIFWVPSPLGIGTLAIALFVAAGMFLKSLLQPMVGPKGQRQTAEG